MKNGQREPTVGEVLKSAHYIAGETPKLVIELKAQEWQDKKDQDYILNQERRFEKDESIGDNLAAWGNAGGKHMPVTKRVSVEAKRLWSASERTIDWLIDLLERKPHYVLNIGVVMSFDQQLMHEFVRRYWISVWPKVRSIQQKKVEHDLKFGSPSDTFSQMKPSESGTFYSDPAWIE